MKIPKRFINGFDDKYVKEYDEFLRKFEIDKETSRVALQKAVIVNRLHNVTFKNNTHVVNIILRDGILTDDYYVAKLNVKKIM